MTVRSVRDVWAEGGAAYDKMVSKIAVRPSRLTPKTYDIPFESISIRTSDGFELAAWHVPGVDRSAPMVVCHHHFGGQRASILGWIRAFHALGLGSISFDARGHAASNDPDGRNAAFAQRSFDVEAACDEARRRGASSVIPFGQSQGAAATVIAAARRRDVAAVVLECGPAIEMFSASWGFAAGVIGRAKARDSLLRASLTARLLRGTEPGRYVRELWPGFAALRERPLLWIHGTADSIIPRDNARIWFELMRPRGARWSEAAIDGAEHIMSIRTQEETVRRELEVFFRRAGLDVSR